MPTTSNAAKNVSLAQPKTVKAKANAATDATATINTQAVTPTAPAAAPAPFVHAHAENGVTGKHYAGLSSYLNANRKARVAIGGAHKYERTPAQLTARTLGTLTAIRAAYNGKQFIARGFDNAVLAMLASSGLIKRVANSGHDITDGATTFAADGEKPLQFNVTPAGLKFGKA